MSWIRWWIWAIFERIERSIRDLIFPWIASITLIFLDSSHGFMVMDGGTNLVLSTFISMSLPSLSPYIHIHFIRPLLTPSNPQPLCSPDVFRLSTSWSRMSTESYSGVTLPLYPWFITSDFCTGYTLYKFQILISLGWLEFYFIWRFGTRQTIVFIIL